MSDDIKKFKAIVENAHRSESKPALNEAVVQKAQAILETVDTTRVTKDSLFGALINSGQIESKTEALNVLSEMRAQLRTARR